MTSKTSTFAVALGLLLAVAGTTSAYAWNKSFTGTRDQVRTACANAGGQLMDGNGATICFNDKNGTSVSCDDDNHCDGHGPRLATYGVLAELGVFHEMVMSDAALARTVTHFRGTRDQVRAACANVGGDLIEGSNYTMCENSKNDTTVECNDKGNCTGGSHPKRVGQFGGAAAFPPESLSSPGSDSASAEPAAPAPADPAPPSPPDFL